MLQISIYMLHHIFTCMAMHCSKQFSFSYTCLFSCAHIAMSAAAAGSNLGQVLPGPAKPKASMIPLEPEGEPPKRAKQTPPCDSASAKVQSGCFTWANTESVVMEWTLDCISQLTEPTRFEYGREKCDNMNELLSIA
jgi:hypothetical protein